MIKIGVVIYLHEFYCKIHAKCYLCPIMKRVKELSKQLKPGEVYRRADLEKWSKAVDRHLDTLVQEGQLQKLAQGLYYCPKQTRFGAVPPDDHSVVAGFLKTDRFLLTSPNAYHSLGLGTTQLYNQEVVYNTKRNGVFQLGHKQYHFKFKPHFPKALTKEFLLVDLVNNLHAFEEEKAVVLQQLPYTVKQMDRHQLKFAVQEYGGAKAQKIFSSLLGE